MNKRGYRAPDHKAPSRCPSISVRQFQRSMRWYVFVNWGDRPAEQVGGFASKKAAQDWIDHDVLDWLMKRLDVSEIHRIVR